MPSPRSPAASARDRRGSPASPRSGASPRSPKGGRTGRTDRAGRGSIGDDDAKSARSGGTAKSGDKTARESHHSKSSRDGKSVTQRTGSDLSPRSSAHSLVDDPHGHGHGKHRRGWRRRLRWPKCRCCMRSCPCFYCCHPDSLLDEASLIASMQAFGGSKTGKKAVNMALVKEQLRQDRENLAEHKRKWRRRWIVCCCGSCCSMIIAVTVIVIILATNDWTLITREAGWSPRVHFGSVYTSGRQLYVIGGTNTIENFGDVWLSQNKGEEWSRLVDSATFGPRHGHALVETSSGQLLVIGGDGGSTSSSEGPVALQDVWKSTDGREWVQVTSSAPWPARKRFGATVDAAGTIFIVGGMDCAGRSGLNDLWKSEDEGVTWTSIALASPWSARHSFAFVRLPGGTREGRLMILGGSDGRAQHDVWASDDSGQSWHRMTFTHVREMVFKDEKDVASWSPRYGMAAVSDKSGKVILCGGGLDESEEDRFSGEIWELESPPSDSVPWYLKRTTDDRLNVDKYPRQWQKKGDPLWSTRRFLQSFMDEEDIVYIIGGQDSFDISGMRNDVWKKETSIDLQNLKDVYAKTTSQASGPPPEDDTGLSEKAEVAERSITTTIVGAS